MIVRNSTRADDDAIINALKEFADYQPLGRLQVEAEHYNDHHIRKILDAIRSNGLCLIAETQEQEIAGVFMGVIAPDIWLPNVFFMNELVWWVCPNHRDSTAGYRLLREYVKQGKQMVEAGRISTFTMTLLDNSPAIDLEKRGWQKIETNYVYEV